MMRTGVKNFIDAAKAFAARYGFAITLTGRRRPLPEIRDANSYKRSYAERQAVNTIIQGSAADVIKVQRSSHVLLTI
jgi:DNA polymerase-1